LALEALRFMAQREGREAVAAFAAQRAERLIAGVTTAGNPMTAQAIADHLSTEGFAATVEPLARDGAQLCMHHCPVVDAAGEFPELCEAETAALGAALGRHVTRLATLAHGDGICTTVIPGVNDDDPGVRSSTSATTIEEKVS
jgi:predicted ArsR family transcriptional regulator